MIDVSSSDPQCSDGGGDDVWGRGGLRACWVLSFWGSCVSPVSGGAFSERPFFAGYSCSYFVWATVGV